MEKSSAEEADLSQPAAMVENIFGYNNCGERQGNRLIKNIRK
jgi:hypothetical protein